METIQNEPLFELGRVLFTPGAIEDLQAHKVSPHELLRRHQSGDWGVMCDEDKAENELSLKEGFRIWSAYQVGDGRLEVITEADRSATTILRMGEY